MARNSPDLVKELYEAFYNFKARLDEITDGSLQFMLSFLSEEDIDHFWLKYTAVDVEEVMNGILITPKMRLLAEEAGCTARIRLKIDKREYETVKEVLHDMSTEYTVPEKTWVRSVAWDKWERYVVDHVHENQAKYLIEQSRVHPIVNELREDDFFFPSLVSYWHDNFYTLPRTLTEATEYAINKDVVRYCEEHGIKIGNMYDVVQEGLQEVGKQAFHNFISEFKNNASFYSKTGKKQIFCRKPSVSCNKRYLLCLLRKKHSNSFVFLNDRLYFYAVAVYLSTNLHEISEEGVLEALVSSKPIALYFVAGILNDKLESFIEPVANYAQTVTPITFESLSLLGSCLLESKCPEKFGEILQHSFESLVLDLSSVTFASVSDYCKEALTFILTKTSIIPEITITNKEEVSGLSKTFQECLKHYIIQPPCSVDIKVENVHELTVFSRFVVFHKLFIAQKHSLVKQHGHISLESIKITAVNTFYDVDYKTALALVKGFASLPLLHSLRFTGFNEKFIINFLQCLTELNARLTVKCMELPHNGLGDDIVSAAMTSIKWLPFLKQIDIRDNKLSGNGCVALLPLADEIDVLVEGNGVQENFEKLLECIPVSDQTRDIVPSLSKLQTIDDIRKLQVKVRDVTEIKVSKLPSDVTHMCSNVSLFSNLENLSLSQCGITKSSAKMLADSFKCLRP
ncbi:uncharacterized protein [Ptychodera flava]|uniref:uncharacterized protein isoform X1 n=1 Tax=Ptychodera flava TaxID=63121 RepID=UPI00396A4038